MSRTSKENIPVDQKRGLQPIGTQSLTLTDDDRGSPRRMLPRPAGR